VFSLLSLAALFTLVSGCSVSQRTTVKPAQTPAPSQTATKAELIAKYNRQAEAVRSLNASLKMKLTGGSNYSGVIEQYHEISGFVLAAKPANIRVIGQAPVVGKNIFDMVSNGEEFRVFIPSKNDFIIGPTNLQRPSKKPIENLRPQHLVDALLWASLPENTPVLFEQANEPQSRYYVLSVLRRTASPDDLEIAQRIWFNRADLNVSRIETYATAGELTSDDSYASWDSFGETRYARQISVARPSDDYQLRITIIKATFNESISEDRFILPQPPGTQLVRAGEETQEKQP
jgi:outer membrane lipoprotein-sorting protein